MDIGVTIHVFVWILVDVLLDIFAWKQASSEVRAYKLDKTSITFMPHAGMDISKTELSN